MKTNKTSILLFLIATLLSLLLIYQLNTYFNLEKQNSKLQEMNFELEDKYVNIDNKLSELEEQVKEEKILFKEIEQIESNFDRESLSYDVSLKLLPKEISENAQVLVEIDNQIYTAEKIGAYYQVTVTLNMTRKYQAIASINDNGIIKNQKGSELLIDSKIHKISPLVDTDFNYSVVENSGESMGITIDYNLFIEANEKLDLIKQMELIASQGDKIISEREIDLDEMKEYSGSINLDGKDKFDNQSQEIINYKLIETTKDDYSYEITLLQTNAAYDTEENIVDDGNGANNFCIVIKNEKGEIIYNSQVE